MKWNCLRVNSTMALWVFEIRQMTPGVAYMMLIFSLFDHGRLSNVQKSSSSVLSEYKNTRCSQVFLDPIKHVLRDFWTASKPFHEKRVSWESEQKFEFSEGKILAYKKNKLCHISILYIKNTNEECFIGIQSSCTWRFVGVLIGC